MVLTIGEVVTNLEYKRYLHFILFPLFYNYRKNGMRPAAGSIHGRSARSPTLGTLLQTPHGLLQVIDFDFQ